jgi:NADH-quinone oxidoreductase B subunit
MGIGEEGKALPQEAAEEEEVPKGIILTTIDKLYGWGRKYSIWPLSYGLACCAFEMIAAAAGRFDIDRFGAGLFRASPRQADCMIVSGTISKKMAPTLVRLYNQMPEPKYVIAMGACAISGGPFRFGYNVVKGVDKYLPVDVYVPGCPPRPDALLQALIMLQEKMQGQSVRDVPWYDGEDDRIIEMPSYTGQVDMDWKARSEG